MVSSRTAPSGWLQAPRPSTSRGVTPQPGDVAPPGPAAGQALGDVGQRGQAEDARPALAGAAAGEVAQHPGGLGEAAGSGGRTARRARRRSRVSRRSREAGLACGVPRQPGTGPSAQQHGGRFWAGLPRRARRSRPATVSAGPASMTVVVPASATVTRRGSTAAVCPRASRATRASVSAFWTSGPWCGRGTPPGGQGRAARRGTGGSRSTPRRDRWPGRRARGSGPRRGRRRRARAGRRRAPRVRERPRAPRRRLPCAEGACGQRQAVEHEVRRGAGAGWRPWRSPARSRRRSPPRRPPRRSGGRTATWRPWRSGAPPRPVSAAASSRSSSPSRRGVAEGVQLFGQAARAGRAGAVVAAEPDRTGQDRPAGCGGGGRRSGVAARPGAGSGCRRRPAADVGVVTPVPRPRARDAAAR